MGLIRDLGCLRASCDVNNMTGTKKLSCLIDSLNQMAGINAIIKHLWRGNTIIAIPTRARGLIKIAEQCLAPAPCGLAIADKRFEARIFTKFVTIITI